MTSAEIEEMAKKGRREYYKHWRAMNKEKVKQHNQTYWAKRAMRKKEAKGGEQDATDANNSTSCSAL